MLEPFLALDDRAGREEPRAQRRVELRRLAPDPFQHHGGVLDFLVARVTEDVAQLVVVRRLHPLLVPVDRLELFLEARERAMQIACARGQSFFRLVEPDGIRHPRLPVCLRAATGVPAKRRQTFTGSVPSARWPSLLTKTTRSVPPFVNRSGKRMIGFGLTAADMRNSEIFRSSRKTSISFR